jgi:hypothetical protein
MAEKETELTDEELEIPAFMRKKIKDNGVKVRVSKGEDIEDKPSEEVELREGSVGAEMEYLGMDLDNLGKNLAMLENVLKPILAHKGEEEIENRKESEPNTNLASQIKDERMKVLDFIHMIRSLTERVDL